MFKDKLAKRKGLFTLPVFLSLIMLLVLVSGGCRDNPAPSVVAPNSTSPANVPVINKVINVAQARSLIAEKQGRPDFVILDVRTAEEFASGHLQNAVNIDRYKPEFKSIISELNRNYTYLLVCRTANRSAQVAVIMKELGFREVYDLSGGIVQWEKDGNPIVKD